MNIKRHEKYSADDKILRTRARKLARQISDGNQQSDVMIVVEFRIAHEIYALGLQRIRIIHPLRELTFIPGTPDFIKGVINLRGEIISVVDLKAFFDLPNQGATSHSQIIILTSEKMEFGILADEVLGIVEISKNDIQASLPTLTGVRSDYLKGVTGNGVVVLDDEKLLGDEKMCINL